MPTKLTAVVALLLAAAGACAAFDEPPQLPPYFTSQPSWVIQTPDQTANGKGQAYLNSLTSQLRVTGTTVWPGNYVYDSDALYECGSADAFYSSWIQVSNGNQTHCSVPDLAAVVGWCALFGNGQLPKLGFVRQTTWNGQPVQAYVYPTLLGFGNVKNAIVYFDPTGTTLLGAVVTTKDGGSTTVYFTNTIVQVPSPSIFAQIPVACQN